MIPSKIMTITLSIFALLSPPLAAQTSVEVNTLKIEGLVVGVPQKIDADFASEHGVAVPKPFQFTIPTDRTKNIKVQYPPEVAGLFKYNFATEDNRYRSGLHVVPFSYRQNIPFEFNQNVEGGPLDILAHVAKMGFAGAVVDLDKSEIDATRQTEIGPYQAVEAIGRYAEADGTVVVLRVVALTEKEGETDGLIAIISALPETTGMKSVGDIVYVDGSRALGTLRFE
ncbi:MAG TPA: hypothetical protein ENK34_01955 [Rhodobacteraceae bacterium]|nr:hypothetical protein [Paracoccaceae bacterium]